jgi:aryl-alcohol dehydrogenase-like predicted oxidoreductase
MSHPINSEMPLASTADRRNVGDIAVFPIGFGCMNLSHGYGGQPSFEEACHLLNHVLDSGVTLLDTAALYGAGANEELLGRAVMHRRGEFMLASKCVLDHQDGRRVLDGRPSSILASLDRSLRRLGTDCIDLFYLHRIDRQVPVEESVGALVRAKEAGKIRAIGLSEVSAGTVARAHAVHPVTAVQNEYSPIARNPEVALLKTCRALEIALIAFSPLGRGMLAGAMRGEGFGPYDIRRRMPRYNAPFVANNLAVAQRFTDLAREVGLAPAQLALAWVLARGRDVVPIPGTTSRVHFDENVAAVSIDIDREAFERVDELFAAEPIQGARHAPDMRAEIDTELLPGEDVRFS